MEQLFFRWAAVQPNERRRNENTVQYTCSYGKTHCPQYFQYHCSIFQLSAFFFRSARVKTSSAITNGSISRQYSPPMANLPRCIIAILQAVGNMPQNINIKNSTKFLRFFILFLLCDCFVVCVSGGKILYGWRTAAIRYGIKPATGTEHKGSVDM